MIEHPLPLRIFRTAKGFTLGEAASLLGVHKTTVLRIETGELQPDADMIERIEKLSEGAVTAADMHATRLAWLKANRPDKFQTVSAALVPEAAA